MINATKAIVFLTIPSASRKRNPARVGAGRQPGSGTDFSLSLTPHRAHSTLPRIDHPLFPLLEKLFSFPDRHVAQRTVTFLLPFNAPSRWPEMTSYRTRSLALLAVVAAATFSFSYALSSAAPTLQIAFTFDDLPAHGPLPPGETRLKIANKTLSALHAAHLPPIYGFVNAAILEKEPDDLSVLQAWRDAGNPLGNHTWSHMNLNQNSLADFEANITRNEPLLLKLTASQPTSPDDWHWFRFPYLAEGDTPAKHDAIRAFLSQRGYKIAAVTMSFSDYLWNEPYARCMAKSDSAAVAQLKSTYLSAASANILYYRQLSQTLYKRDIPYVLLMHIGALDAEMLPKLLDLYRSRGFRFITLPQAERDPFYRLDTNPSLPSGPTTFEDALRARNLPVPAPPASPLDFNSLCR